MAAEGGFEFDREENLPGGSFSKLLLSDEDVVVGAGPYCSPVFLPQACSSTLFSLDTPKMLCFGDYSVHDDDENGGGSLITSQTFSSSPVSKSSSNASITSLPKTSDSNKRCNGSSEKNDSGAGDKIGPKKSRAVAGARGSRSGPFVLRPSATPSSESAQPTLRRGSSEPLLWSS